SAGAGRCRPLVAALPARAAARAQADPLQVDVLAVGFARARWHRRAGSVAGARAPFGLRVRAGPRALPPAPPRPLRRLLAGGGGALPGLARRAGLLPVRGPAAEGHAAGAAAAARSRLSFSPREGTVPPPSPPVPAAPCAGGGHHRTRPAGRREGNRSAPAGPAP